MKPYTHSLKRSFQHTPCWRGIVFFCAILSLPPALRAAPATDPQAADLIEAHAPLADPGNRARAMEALRIREQERQTQARARALQLGLPLRGSLPGGGAFELAEFDGDQPLYKKTCNVNAGISIGANILRAAPYFADGTGGTIGLWDASSALTTHQEFGGRVTTKDGSSATEDHSSHVAGTLCAVGLTASARGMATNAWVDSYDWNSDTSEMTGRGASYAGESGKIYVSSHSYGMTCGWAYTGGTNPAWIWYGTGTTAAGYETDFGMYNTYSRDVDALAYNLPYYLIFWAASNERNNNPSAGQYVALSSLTPSVTVAYNATLHPPGDGTYRNGYDTISYCALSKNVVTVGAVYDAQNGGSRYLPWATMTDFSSWGPTDDGRIKPDVVANGYYVYSCLASATNAYGYMSGTSMATPSAAGLAQQLVGYYKNRFAGQYMRASTLKGLLIHTADDLGTAGPDYQFGWGLLNGQAAADLISAAATNPLAPRLIEQQLTTAVTTRTHTFTWNGVSPIRVTLCWTDPAGTATATSDSRTPRLVNDLNLRLVGPTGTQHFPYVMPFVGTWTTESMSAAAGTGTNNTDNVEQVLIASPSLAGTYQAVVSTSGSLYNSNPQSYSLLISGSSISAPNPQSVTPSTGSSGLTTLTVAGESFASGASVSFVQAGHTNVATVINSTTTNITCTLDVTSMDVGFWDVLVRNPDGKSGTLSAAFRVLPPSVIAVAPNTVSCGQTPLTLTGSNFAAGASITFFKTGSSDVPAVVSNITFSSIACSVDVTGMANGAWDVRVINPLNKTGTLASALTVSPPIITAVSPNMGSSGMATLNVAGASFASGATVTFFRSDYSDVPAAVSAVTLTNITCSVDVSSMAAGLWSVRVTNTNGKSGSLADAFTVIAILFSQDFDPDAPGWTTSVTLGSGASAWALSSVAYHTPTNAYRIACPSTKKTDNLISESIYIPSAAQYLQFHFWHVYNTETYDGGILELSHDNGATWYEIGTTGSGTAFVKGSYTATVTGRGGNKANRAEFYGKSAWSGSNGGSFTEVVVSLDAAVFAKKNLRARWRMSTDALNDPGTWFWSVDSVSITGYAPPSKSTLILLQ